MLHRGTLGPVVNTLLIRSLEHGCRRAIFVSSQIADPNLVARMSLGGETIQIARQTDAVQFSVADLDDRVPRLEPSLGRRATLFHADQTHHLVAIDMIGNGADHRRRNGVTKEVNDQDIDGEARGADRTDGSRWPGWRLWGPC